METRERTETTPLKEGEIVELWGLPGWTVISVYTRAQALEDGTLIDVTATARRAGWKLPVAITCGVFAVVQKVADTYNRANEGKLKVCPIIVAYSLLYRFAQMARHEEGDRMYLRGAELLDVPIPEIIAHIGPGDTPDAVLTIMLPEED